MSRLVHYLIRYGVTLVFFNVLLEQIGAPVPAVPTLIVAGALSRANRMSSTHVLIAAVTASLIADWLWFLLGRRYGYRVLRTLCRISLSPDSCVRETEARFERWGLKSLLIAKFVPGFSTVAPPLAGAAKHSTLGFLVYDALGALAWAGAAVAAGRAFHRAIDRVLIGLESLGWWAVAIVMFLLAIVVAIKWAQRRRFYVHLRMARVSVHELKEMFDRGEDPLVVDARSAAALHRDGRRIPTAIVVHDGTLERRLDSLPRDREIVVYCT